MGRDVVALLRKAKISIPAASYRVFRKFEFIPRCTDKSASTSSSGEFKFKLILQTDWIE